MGLQIRERMAFDVQGIAGNKILDDVLATFLAGQELEDIARAGADHGVMSRATDECVLTGPALQPSRTAAADEFRGSRAAHDRDLAVDRDVLVYAVELIDLQLPAPNGGVSEGAIRRPMDRGMALLGDGRIAGIEGYRVVPRGTMFRDRAATPQSQRIRAAADRNGALFAPNGDIVVTAAGFDTAITIDLNAVVAAANGHIAAARDGYEIAAITSVYRPVTVDRNVVTCVAEVCRLSARNGESAHSGVSRPSQLGQMLHNISAAATLDDEHLQEAYQHDIITQTFGIRSNGSVNGGIRCNPQFNTCSLSPYGDILSAPKPLGTLACALSRFNYKKCQLYSLQTNSQIHAT
jgi:hypothetical protein